MDFFFLVRYEVKTEGDAFMCAFGDPLVAVRWCLDAQEKVLFQKCGGEFLLISCFQALVGCLA